MGHLGGHAGPPRARIPCASQGAGRAVSGGHGYGGPAGGHCGAPGGSVRGCGATCVSLRQRVAVCRVGLRCSIKGAAGEGQARGVLVLRSAGRLRSPERARAQWRCSARACVAQERIRERGLGLFPAEGLPTEEAMVRFERLAKTAASKGRLYLGSAEGEDLQAHFKPPWCRSPELDMVGRRAPRGKESPPVGSPSAVRARGALSGPRRRLHRGASPRGESGQACSSSGREVGLCVIR